MKKCSESKKIRPIILVLTLLVTILGGYVFTRNEIYRSIKVTNVASSVIEYGSANYNIKKLIKTNGKIVSVKNDIDAYDLGKQKVSVVVAKGSIEKEIDVSIEVIDTNAPVIDISQDNISITQGDELNLLDNISFISLDTFKTEVHNVSTKRDAWLKFMTEDDPDEIVRFVNQYPEFLPCYHDLIAFRQNPKELVNMFSDALREMDKNTERYMVEELNKEVSELKEENISLTKRIAELEAQLNKA